MSLKQSLIAARALIATPEQWTKNTSARDGRGMRCSVWASDAVCFCIFGTIDRVSRPDPLSSARDGTELTHALEEWLPPNLADYSLDEFNDDPDTTHQMVLDLYDRAIAAAED